MKSRDQKNYYEKQKEIYMEMYWENNNCRDIFLTNGFNDFPITEYKEFKDVIDKSKISNHKILDLGCGNGLLLNFLQENVSAESIKIFGVDFLNKSIEQAKKLVKPVYDANFQCCNIIDYNFQNMPFSVIITNPFYIHKGQRSFFFNLLKEKLTQYGIIIFYAYGDTIKNNELKELINLEQLLNSRNIIYLKNEKINLGVFEKL